VWHKGTLRLAVLLLVAGGLAGFAQSIPKWRRVGGSSVDLNLAGPATGPVVRVWFSADGGVLFARTTSGKVFQTADFESWFPAPGVAEPSNWQPAVPVRAPAASAQVVSLVSNPNEMFALGEQLYRSSDGGHSWANLTAYKSESVLGGGIHSVAVSSADPNHLVAANDYGVWRSLDGGLSWSGLNQFLPNLAVRRILSTPSGTTGTRVQADGMNVLELPPGGAIWRPASAPPQDSDIRALRYSAMLGAPIAAVAVAGDTVYAGSLDGRIWVSVDGGRTFPAPPWQTGGGAVEKLIANSSQPWVALAALSGAGHHVLRTTNSGTFWDSLDYDLPSAPAHSVAADWQAGAVYVATDKGVFHARTDLQTASSSPVNWQSLSGRLPSAPATDVALDPAAVQLYAALEGYGVFATAAPHRAHSLRIVSAADFSVRPAAPGSLLSVEGGHVSSARGANLNYPVLAASDTESQIQVPFEAVGPSVALALQTLAGDVTLGLAVQPVSPAILLALDGAPVLYDADTQTPLDARNGAHSNGRLLIVATGLGRVQPSWPTGVPAPIQDPPVVAANVKVFLDGAPLQVNSATLAPGYVGFYQVEAQLPAIANLGTSELHISVDGQESNRVQLNIEP
jgi:uncharacterized protein (TIGR03437 family)